MNHLSPFNALNELHHELGRVFDSRYGLVREPAAYDASNWSPHVDIREDEAAFTVLADVPGVSPEHVDVSLHHGVLTIKGERNDNSDESTGAWRRQERVRGVFMRQFSLPESAAADDITAKVTNGVLEITIPKAAKPEPQSIKVVGDD